MFSPLTVARKLAGDRLRGDLRTAPEAVGPALEAIAETMSRHSSAALEAGADGLFFATQTSCPGVFTRDESARWRCLSARSRARGRGSTLTVLDLHGLDVYFDLLAGLPAHAIHWHDRLTAHPERGAPAHLRALVGGLNEGETLRRGDGPAAGAEARDAVQQAEGTGLILAPGSSSPSTCRDHALEAVLEGWERTVTRRAQRPCPPSR